MSYLHKEYHNKIFSSTVTQELNYFLKFYLFFKYSIKSPSHWRRLKSEREITRFSLRERGPRLYVRTRIASRAISLFFKTQRGKPLSSRLTPLRSARDCTTHLALDDQWRRLDSPFHFNPPTLRCHRLALTRLSASMSATIRLVDTRPARQKVAHIFLNVPLLSLWVTGS